MTIADNLRDIQAHIESAKTRKGTNQAVKIIAVTKTHPFSIINTCYNNGIHSIGENRVQEAIKKFQKLSGVPRLIKRFIGHLQTNKVNKSKSIPVVPKKLIFPFILLTSLFALWGFANAVTDPMVQAFKKVLELSNTQAAWVQMAFYGGYFCMALPAALFMRKYSYKVGILIGLGLYATGALLFYPAAISEEFSFFCIGLYILTFGLAFLETAANPYALSMGAKETATQRLNLAQSFNPMGLILGLFVAQQYVLKKLQSDDISDFSALDEVSKNLIKTTDLMVIRDPYVILGLVILGVLVLFAVSKMPDSKDDNSNNNIGETIKKLVNNSTYSQGVIAQILYVGAQIMCWTYIYQYAEGIKIDSVTAGYYQMVASVSYTHLPLPTNREV